MPHSDLVEKVKEELTRYLDANPKYRKTQERFAILEQIYSTEGHFDVETLLKSMSEEKRFRISRATMYNTINLLVNARLVSKFQFGNQSAQYERIFGIEGHHHLVCTECGEVQDVKDRHIKGVMHQRKIPRFSWEYYSFYIYGVCSKCSYRIRREKSNAKKLNSKNTKK